MKILAVSDVHIHDYPQRNPSEKYRLYQGSRTVAQNIIDVAKEQGAEVLVLAGDVMEKPINRPYVLAEIKTFIDTLSSHFKTIFTIAGNHDIDNKSSDQDSSDCCLGVMRPANVVDADKKIIEIEGSRIAFCNWSPEFDLSWIDKKVDILFTHATISYSEDDLYPSQVLDESKFDLAICGDIHRPVAKGKYVSIGIPQRCKMGDSEYTTGVLLDCTSRKWEWVNLNPHDNLMKFEYTEIPEQEGWNKDTGVWKVYKPANILGGPDPEAPDGWININQLIEGMINSLGLGAVHSEVLKDCKDSGEVDFRFQLTRFYCKNWRSIEECEILFNPGDRFQITGQNGSGKSSLLTALKYALLENRSIKDFIQFGEKECLTEVEFMYQGIKYKIQRGSKKYGFWIDGVPQKYTTKSVFEKDMHQRFPFIDYSDVYIFDSDHHKFIGGISPERKSEITCKLLGITSIDSYNNTAQKIYSQKTREITDWQGKRAEQEKLKMFIMSKLSLLTLPTDSLDTLTQYRNEGLDLQKAWMEWNSYMTKTANLQATKRNILENIEREKKDMTGFRDRRVVQGELQQKQDFLNSITSAYQALMGINQEGRRLTEERESLERSKVCRVCGQPIKNTADLERHKQEIDSQIAALTQRQKQAVEWFAGIGLTQDIITARGGFNSITAQYNQEISLLMTELNKQEQTFQNLKRLEEQKKQVDVELSKIGVEPKQVTLPDNFMEIMGKIETGINTWREHLSLSQDLRRVEAEIDNCNSHLAKIQEEVSQLQEYIVLTSTTGKIYEEVLTKLAKQFTDNQVRYDVKTYEFRGKKHLDLASSFVNGKNYVPYQACSSGQQTFLDIDFLSKITQGGLGLLIMDEFLKHLDPLNHDLCIDAISKMKIGCIMLSSHMESISAFNNRFLKMELQNGKTKVICT